MNRRGLLGGGLQALVGGQLLAKASDAQPCEGCVAASLPVAASPDAKLTVKPVMTAMIHTGVWEGPCRFNVVSVAKEAENAKRAYDNWVKAVRSGKFNFGDQAELMEPHLITFAEDFTLPAAQLLPLEQESGKTDVYFISPGGSSIATFDIARRFHKPAILFGLDCRTVDIAAYAKTRGEEIFVVNDNEELRKTLSLLRALKVFRNTRILFPTNRGFPSVASLTGVSDLQDLENRLGVVVKMISYKVLSEEMERTLNNRSEQQKAEQAADELIGNAEHSYLDRKYVVRSVQFHQTISTLMNAHGCNAFTIECFEFCSSRLPEKWKITPCLVHALFKDRGLASACEGDLGALLGMRLLMSVSGKSSHLGNMFLRDGNSVVINHSAPGIKMNGFDRPGLPYKLGRFTRSGWGAKVVVDFMGNSEKRVTVARMHPSARKLLVMKGQLVGSEGWDKDLLGCSVTAIIRPVESGDGKKFVRRQTEYGNHLVWVYGDYSAEMEQLGRLMDLEVEVIA